MDDDQIEEQPAEESTTARVPVDQADAFGRHREYVEADAEFAWHWDARRWKPGF